MSDTKPSSSPDLSALSADYEIVGELDTRGGPRTYMATQRSDDARRRDDSTGVLIAVATTPAGDEANALTQYAADTKALVGLTHRRLVPVLEGRWIGDDAFAVVTRRVNDPTLAQRLATGETFHSTRIAAILREVNGLLEWAREQKIVHRRVTPEQIHLEQKTDRVRVNFAIAPITRLQQPGAHDDARTIGRLAVAMLGGDPESQARDEAALAGLRPGLPQAFSAATVALLDPRRSPTPEELAAYLALIGMAEPVAAGETERDRIRAEVLEEQRLEREKLANERIEFDQQIAKERAEYEQLKTDERARFDTEMADERARLARERADLEKAVTRERDELQRAAETERAALVATRAELERTVAEQRANIERVAASDRADIERLRAELQHAGDQEIEQKRLAALEDFTGEEPSALDADELATPAFAMPTLVPIQPLVFDDDTPVMQSEPIAFPAEKPEPAVVTREPATAATSGSGTPPNRRRNQLIAGAIAAVVIVGGASALVMSSRAPAPQRAPRTVAAPVVSTAPPVAAGTAPAAPVAPLAFTVDSATARLWLDSLRRAHPTDVSWAIEIVQARLARAARARAAARDSVVRGAAVPNNAGSIIETVPGASVRRDTIVRRDTVFRRDTTPAR